jgi:hypothetical protein
MGLFFAVLAVASLAWAQKAHGMGHHDWAYGYGFLIPRIYTEYVQRTFLEFEKLGAPIRYAYAEPGVNWGLDGPKLYLIARIWWNPHVDVTAELKRYCDDMFGDASLLMLEYFKTLEHLYCDHRNRRTEQKLFRYERQFLNWTDGERSMLAGCRTFLDEASAVARAAGDREAQQRIELFSKTLRYAEMLVAIGNSETVTQKQVAAIKKYAAEVIVPDAMTVHRRNDDVLKQLDNCLGKITAGRMAPSSD